MNVYFYVGILIGFIVVFILWLIYRYVKWVDKVDCELNSIRAKVNQQESYIDNLKVVTRSLRKSVLTLEKVDDDEHVSLVEEE